MTKTRIMKNSTKPNPGHGSNPQTNSTSRNIEVEDNFAIKLSNEEVEKNVGIVNLKRGFISFIYFCTNFDFIMILLHGWNQVTRDFWSKY
ncbi:hypothetical protein Lalb_Chr20g0109091 [Lupinus albus]|uniref:Uncharacterized protein n=1 Tax=Lupinus albus TaxID=3870 RepID=A0A6A4NT71_LUPAL|nr:hypothetical protein Lalb_Chr20g0109091 [Lupinus albus]